MNKRDVLKYIIIILLIIIIVSIFFLLRKNLTGKSITAFAIFEQSNQSSFSEGTYINTTFNGSAIILSGTNLTGSYTSKIFDASNNANWNNLSLQKSEPSLIALVSADINSDIWKSLNLGTNWSLIKDDYNGEDVNGIVDLEKNSTHFFLLYNQKLWISNDNGLTWTKINNDYNGAEGQNGDVLGIDKNYNYIYIIEGDQDVWRSENGGTNFSKLISNFNGGNGVVLGLVINSSGAIFATDVNSDVWVSLNYGINWTLVKDDFNGAIGNSVDDMAIDSNNNLYILDRQDFWKSTDNGISWTLVNDDINGGADSNDGLVSYIDENNYIYIIDGSEDFFKSSDGGITFSKTISNFNEGNGNALGLTSYLEFTNLSVQVKNCSQPDCSDGIWQSLNIDDLNLVSRYFQYKIIFTTPDSISTPAIYNISIDYSLVNSPPSINILSPQEGITYGYNESLNLNFTVSDINNNLDSCWFNIDNGTNETISNCQNITFDTSEGNHILRIYANDSFGEEAEDSVTFNIQVGAPTIILHFPINNYLNYHNIEFNYTPSDIDLDSCELWGNFDGEFKINQTDNLLTSGEINTFSLYLLDGTYLWNIKCNDTIGNSVFNGNKTFYIDSINPNLTLIEPTGTKTSRTSIPISFITSDASPLTCWYNVHWLTGGQVIADTIIPSCSSTTFDVSVNGNYVLNLYANDSAGNLNFSSLNFSVETIISSSSSSSSSGGGGGGSSTTTINQTGKLELSEIGEIIVQPGDKKTLSLNVKNIGKNFLNNCRLVSSKDISPWIYSSQVQGIAPGENSKFIFDLNVPENLEEKDYSGKIEIKCDEDEKSQLIKIIIPKSLQIIKIKEILYQEDKLNISYSFDNTNIVGDSISIEIWINDEEENEIKRITDSFLINKEGLIERNVIINIPKDLTGIYYIYFALSSDLNNPIKQPIILGKSKLTGMAVFRNTKNKIIGYSVFILIIAVGLFFIIRSYFSESKELKDKKQNNPKKE